MLNTQLKTSNVNKLISQIVISTVENKTADSLLYKETN